AVKLDDPCGLPDASWDKRGSPVPTYTSSVSPMNEEREREWRVENLTYKPKSFCSLRTNSLWEYWYTMLMPLGHVCWPGSLAMASAMFDAGPKLTVRRDVAVMFRGGLSLFSGVVLVM